MNELKIITALQDARYALDRCVRETDSTTSGSYPERMLRIRSVAHQARAKIDKVLR